MRISLNIFFRFIFVLDFLGKSGVCYSQTNLVPNPSFEDTVLCPHSTNQVDRAVGWHPSRNSPDYFNECDWINGTLAVPNNFQGYQYAHTGMAYCGFIPYTRNDSSYRENFTCQLISPLTIGTKYLVSYYISHADFNYRLSCNKMGVLFSTIDYNINNNSPTNNFCQFFTDSIITDTANWVLVSGSLIADSAYNYLSIGNFFESYLVDTIYQFPSYASAYYYIDDIMVIQDTNTLIKELNQLDLINLHPNPFLNEIKIISPIEFTYIQIFNIRGQLLQENIFNMGLTELTLTLPEYSTGIYYLKMFYKNRNIKNFKLIKL